MVATGGEVLDSEGRPLKLGDRIVPGRQRRLRRLPFLPQRLSLLHVREHARTTATACIAARLRISSAAGRSTCTCCPARRSSGCRTICRTRRGADGDHVGDAWRGDGAGASRPRSAAAGLRQSIAVLGVGPLGLCHLIKAKLLGAGQLIATDRFASRLAMAEAFGASLDHAGR